MKCVKDFRRFPLLALFTASSFLATIHPTALAQDGRAEPTIRKDSIIASIYSATRTEWRADFKFEVNTPFTREDRLWVDVLYPGRRDRITRECEGDTAGENKADFRCQGPDPHYNTAVGVVDFEIHMANELSGTNLVLFRGKMKVLKGRENAGRPADYFHVDEDWRIPIAYLYRDREEHLNFAVWWFGEGIGSLEVTSHLFHEGKAIAKADLCGGAPVSCSFRTDGIHPVPALSPGAYEIKVLKEGRLKRTATFTVNEDGSFDNGIASANKLGSDKVIIPVSVVGDLPRPWNKLAWKTEAFYGNPLTGFTAPP